MVDLSIYKRHSRLYGFLCTAFITGLLFLIFFLFVIRTPNPPYPESGGGGTGNGIELNLGFSDLGSGNTPSEAILPEENITTPAKNEMEEEKIAKQDNEEAPVIQETSKQTKKADKKEIKKVKTAKPIKETKVEKPTIKQPIVNANALYKPRQTSADGASNTPGDQGSPDGDLAAKAFGKGGKGGSGGGSGGGTGTGIGTGIGSGIEYNLDKRNIDQAPPKPEYNGQEEGYVVVEITVNKEGVVTQAVYKMKGSSTNDNSLIEAAKKSALQAKFNRKPDAPAFQKGTIRYRFKLQ